MGNFVLIHGAMHGGWCWERVAPLLEAQGHTVLCPDLPGLGADTTPATQVTLDRWANFIAAKLPARAILAGHSLGGMAISQAAELAPEKIAVLAYVTALLPRDGDTPFVLTRQPSAPAEAQNLAIEPSPDGNYFSLAPHLAKAGFYNNTQALWVARALAALVPQPGAVMLEAARLTPAGYGRLPRAYIECLRDQAISIDLQRGMQAASPCDYTATIDTDHSPFYSTPEILAAELIKISEKFP